MKKNVLLKTNIFICAVIVLGFLLTSFISYNSNNRIFKKDIERISTLTCDGIYHEIDTIFTKPVNISLTMANDSLLKTFLREEESRGDEEEFIETMRDYLFSYKEKYDYDSVFLVSAKTGRYYHYDQGIDRIITEGNPENQWYYDALQDTKEYGLNIDNDEVQSANNEVNIFVNCKIYAPDREIMGIVGVGFGVDTLQEMFRNYEDNSQLRAYLVGEDGTIEISTKKNGFEKANLLDEDYDSQYDKLNFSDTGSEQSYWYSAGGRTGHMAAKYVPSLEWYLIIDKDTTNLEADLHRQFLMGMAVVVLVIIAVLFIITSIIQRYNAYIVCLAAEREKAHRTIFQTETEKLYENIYELDITHDRAANEATQKYFESLGVPRDMPYHKALHVIAQAQIKKEYREGYVRTFSPENVLKTYEAGQDSLKYDFLITTDGGYTYYWMRITTRIFYWEDDQTVRMLIYRQNVDQEKRREMVMAEKMRMDSLSGLYNKAAAQELVRQMLLSEPKRSYAFFIMDIDDFKMVNDTYGHAVGDQVIADFGDKLSQQFREGDIIGRIGGDEFMVFLPIPSAEWAKVKAQALSQALEYEFTAGEECCQISASIGVAIYPEAGKDFETLYQNGDKALYQTKRMGKSGYTVYSAE